MAKIPATQRLNSEDFKSQLPWIDKLLFVLNRFFADVISALSNNLTVNENMLGQVSSIDISTAALTTAGTTPSGSAVALPTTVALQQTYNFKWNRKISPAILIVGHVVEKVSNPDFLFYGVTPDWYYKDGQIYIQALSGLKPNKTYTVTFVALAG